MARIVKIFIDQGKNNYCLDSACNWMILMWGTFSPEDKGIPRYKWLPIDEGNVPEEVIKKGMEIF